MKKINGESNIKTIIILLLIFFILGFVLYEIYFKNTKYYTVIDGQISKSQIKKSMTKEEAIEKANEIIKKLSDQNEEVQNFDIKQFIKGGELYWDLENDVYKIEINAINKNLISYSNKNVEQENKVSEDEAKNALNEIIENLEIPKEYELEKLQIEYDLQWHAELAKKHHDVFNEYEGIELYFSPQTKQIASLEFKNYIYTDNEEKITSDEAEKIARDTYQEDDIKDVIVEKSIEQVDDRRINSDVYIGDEYEVENISEVIEYMNKYKENRQIRNVWKVTIKNVDNNVAIYAIDVTDGNIIRKAFIKGSNLND